MRRLITFVLALFMLGAVAPLIAQAVARTHTLRALPDDNLAMPVLITFKNGSSVGSGFFFDNGISIYLVTAKHVLFDPNTHKFYDTECQLVSYSSDLSDATPNVVEVNLPTLGSENIKAHPSEDVAMAKIGVNVIDAGTKLLKPLSGVTLKQAANEGIVTVHPETIKTFKDVLIGNEVIVMGYPTSLGLKEMPQFDSHRPLLRKGIVAGEDSQKRSIIIDCPSYPGNSGSPVLEIDVQGFDHRFATIGIVSQYVPYADGGKTFAIMANSGYSVVTPITRVQISCLTTFPTLRTLDIARL
ncbi:MAG: serine protease [Bryobacteraceae bacterium]|jgi:hypothetical protein